MSFNKTCCTLPPVVSNYKPKGSEVKIGDLDVYETENKTFNRVLICAYDIFGVHPNIRQFADTLALAGYRIVIPDFFRGHKMDHVNFPPKDFQEIYDFVAAHGSWQKTVKTDVQNVVKHYQEIEGIQLFGIFGFCWGGRISLDAATEIPEIKAAGLVHPSIWKTEDANGVKAPMILLPAKDEDDMIPFYNILKKNLGEDKCAHNRFDDMFHGFCGARGDFGNTLNAQRTNEVISFLQKFFDKHVA